MATEKTEYKNKEKQEEIPRKEMKHKTKLSNRCSSGFVWIRGWELVLRDGQMNRADKAGRSWMDGESGTNKELLVRNPV